METTEAILLTAVVNIIITGLISGVVIYSIQRKIDSSFQEKFEKLRSDLQYTQFQKQTMFSKSFPKSLEALETYHQKVLNYANFTEELLEESAKENGSGKTPSKDIISERTQKLLDGISDINTFFALSRLHIPDETINKIIKINGKLALTMIDSISFILRPNEISDTETFIRDVSAELRTLSRETERMYKSITNIQ